MNETDSKPASETERSNRLLSSILLICITLNSLILVYFMAISSISLLKDRNLWILMISLIAFICLLVINQRGYFRTAVSATLLFLSFMILHFAAKIGDSSSYFCYILYLIVPILLSSLLLSVKKTFIISLIILAVLITGYVFIKDSPYARFALDSLAFLAITSTFIIYIAYYRKKQEMARVQELMAKEKHLQQTLEEKDVLIKEVHHRVKNNLQVIISLLNLQSYHFKNKQILKFIQDSKHRILSIAEVHENLYQSSNLSKIEFSRYIHSVTKGLMNAYSTNQNVKLTLQIEPFDLDINYAVPCGLIINELTTNALKHAFPDKRSGNIIIRCEKRNNTVELEIRDNGIGIPDNIPLQSKKSMGMTLVNILTEQINGSISIKREKETSIKITFDIAS